MDDIDDARTAIDGDKSVFMPPKPIRAFDLRIYESYAWLKDGNSTRPSHGYTEQTNAVTDLGIYPHRLFVLDFERAINGGSLVLNWLEFQTKVPPRLWNSERPFPLGVHIDSFFLREWLAFVCIGWTVVPFAVAVSAHSRHQRVC